MLAQQNDVFKETCETIFQKNQDEKVRYWCEAREEAERVARTVNRDFAKQIAERDSIIAEQNNTIAEQNNTIAEKDAQIAMLKAQLAQTNH